MTGVGKIGDIYDRRGIPEDVHTEGNADHSREYVPLLVRVPGRDGVALGTRETFADLGATVAEYFGLAAAEGRSFLGDAEAHP